MTRKEIQSKYDRSEKGKARQKKYILGPKYKARQASPALADKKLAYSRTEISRRARRIYNKANRVSALNKYSGNKPICACPGCGERRIEFLAIDHIEGNGNLHRRETKCGSGSAFYSWLKRNDYPRGFHVLCHNCNMSHGFYGYCPHEREVAACTP